MLEALKRNSLIKNIDKARKNTSPAAPSIILHLSLLYIFVKCMTTMSVLILSNITQALNRIIQRTPPQSQPITI